MLYFYFIFDIFLNFTTSMIVCCNVCNSLCDLKLAMTWHCILYIIVLYIKTHTLVYKARGQRKSTNTRAQGSRHCTCIDVTAKIRPVNLYMRFPLIAGFIFLFFTFIIVCICFGIFMNNSLMQYGNRIVKIW